MVFNRSFGAAVITVHPGFRVLKLGWHGLTFDRTLQVAELHFHVHYAAAADRAAVGGVHVFVVAALVDAMAAAHEDHGAGGTKHVFPAYRAVTVCRSLDAAVGVADRHGDANAACLCDSVNVE